MESAPFAPGSSGAIVCLLPRLRRVAAVDMDPPTAAAFTVDRLDELTPGETHVLCGELAPALRLVVTNTGAAVARFRAAVATLPELARVEAQIGRVVERDWRTAYDAARKHGAAPAAPIVSLPAAKIP